MNPPRAPDYYCEWESSIALSSLSTEAGRFLKLERKSRLQCSSRGRTRGPRPLEVVATQMPGYIHHFTDEIQPRHLPRLHGFRREFVSIDTADGHFGLLETLCISGCDRPCMRLLFPFGERGIGPRRRWMQVQPAIRKPVREHCSQLRPQVRKIPREFWIHDRR